MNCLLIGYGYLGTRVLEAFAAAGHKVSVLSRSVRASDDRGKAAGKFNCDLASEPLPSFKDRFDVVIYCISPDGPSEEAYEAAYVKHLGRVLDWHSSHAPSAKFILTSSTGIYGDMEGAVIDENTPFIPRTPIQRLLNAGEAAVKERAKNHFIVRLAGIYGPGRVRMFQVLGGAYKDSLRSDASESRGSNESNENSERATYLETTLNLIHVVDAARLCLHLASDNCPPGIYLGVDCEPSKRKVIAAWIAQHRPEVFAGDQAASLRAARGSKRCLSAKALAHGFKFQYPHFRLGIPASLVGEQGA